MVPQDGRRMMTFPAFRREFRTLFNGVQHFCIQSC
jgi:hypothetical protein